MIPTHSQTKRPLLMGARGFTLVELVLYIALSAIILGVTSQVMLSQVNTFAYVTFRQESLTDIRYALNRINSELLHLETADISTIDVNEIQFIDQNSNNTSFRVGVSGGQTALMRGAEVLYSPIQSFQISYLDEAGASTNQISDVRKFQITIATAPQGTEGSISLTTEVTPRSFLYEGYE